MVTTYLKGPDGKRTTHYFPETAHHRRNLAKGWFLVRNDLMFDRFEMDEILFDSRCIVVPTVETKAIQITNAFIQCGMCHRRFTLMTQMNSTIGTYYPLQSTICKDCFRKRVPPLVAGLVRDSKREAEESFDAFSDECTRASKRPRSSTDDTTTEAEEPSSLVSDQ